MGMNNNSVRPNNRPKIMNNKGMRANYRRMGALCALYERKYNG